MQCIVNETLISYKKEGSGPVVLVLHGWATSAGAMQSVIDALSPTHTVVALDLPGFGGSEQPHEAWSVGDYAQCVHDFLKKIGVEQLKGIVGHSFGGRVIIKALSQELLAPHKVVLIGSAGVKHSDSFRNKTFKVIAKTGKIALRIPGLRGISSRARTKLYERAGSVDYLNSGTMKDIFLNTINEDLAGVAHKVACPTLLIWGSEDMEAPLADGEYFDRVMPRSELKVIHGAGHFVYDTHKDQVSQWLQEFFA